MKKAILGFILGIAITISLAGGYMGDHTICWYTEDCSKMKKFIDNQSKKGYHVIEFEMIPGNSTSEGKYLFVIMEK
jgi:hypothetical protein